MRINRISISVLRIPLLKPFVSSVRRVESTEDIVVQIETDSGLTGIGAATPSLRMNGESVHSIIAVVRDAFATLLLGRDPAGYEALLAAIDKSVIGNTAAKASIDIALHDLAAQSAGLPLFRFLGGDSQHITTGITISHNPVEEMVSDACVAVSEGFTTLKIKLGSPQGIEDDLHRVKEIRRSIGNQVEIGVDANQAWSVKDSLNFVDNIYADGVRLAFIEQPVVLADRYSLGRVSAMSRVPVIADESCTSLEEGVDLLTENLADGLAIKLMKLGGIRAARTAYGVARLKSKICVATCLTESPISVAAMASFCSGRDFRFIDLDSMALITDSPIIGGAQIRSNQLVLSDEPGLGIHRIDSLERIITID